MRSVFHAQQLSNGSTHTGGAVHERNLPRRSRKGRGCKYPCLDRVEAARGSLSCVQDTDAIERGTAYSSTLPCTSLWTEPGAAITNHSNAPPSQAACHGWPSTRRGGGAELWISPRVELLRIGARYDVRIWYRVVNASALIQVRRVRSLGFG